jgi:hypothetical protein
MSASTATEAAGRCVMPSFSALAGDAAWFQRQPWVNKIPANREDFGPVITGMPGWPAPAFPKPRANNAR